MNLQRVGHRSRLDGRACCGSLGVPRLAWPLFVLEGNLGGGSPMQRIAGILFLCGIISGANAQAATVTSQGAIEMQRQQKESAAQSTSVVTRSLVDDKALFSSEIKWAPNCTLAEDRSRITSSETGVWIFQHSAGQDSLNSAFVRCLWPSMFFSA